MLKLTPQRLRIVRFAVVGGSGVVVNLGMFSLCHYVLFVPLFADADVLFTAANIAGVVVSILTNFLLNDVWTWGDRQKGGRGHFFLRLTKFYGVAGVAGLVQIGVASAVRSGFDFPDVFAVLTGIGVATFVNFGANHLWTFRDYDAGEDAS